MTVLRFNRDQLLEALEARKGWAAEIDAENLATHAKDEKAALVEFRAKCREALKWDYKTAKGNYFSVEKITRPYCPNSLVSDLDRHINHIVASRQVRFVISESGAWSRVHYLLTHDRTIKPDLCE